MLKMYACIIPVINPNTVINTGKNKGAILKRIVTIKPPLIILPKRRTANANVRDISLMILKGSMMNVGSINVFKYCKTPFSAIPKMGVSRKTHSAKAAVVDNELVGGS